MIKETEAKGGMVLDCARYWGEGMMETIPVLSLGCTWAKKSCNSAIVNSSEGILVLARFSSHNLTFIPYSVVTDDHEGAGLVSCPSYSHDRVASLVEGRDKTRSLYSVSTRYLTFFRVENQLSTLSRTNPLVGLRLAPCSTATTLGINTRCILGTHR